MNTTLSKLFMTVAVWCFTATTPPPLIKIWYRASSSWCIHGMHVYIYAVPHVRLSYCRKEKAICLFVSLWSEAPVLIVMSELLVYIAMQNDLLWRLASCQFFMALLQLCTSFSSAAWYLTSSKSTNSHSENICYAYFKHEYLFLLCAKWS